MGKGMCLFLYHSSLFLWWVVVALRLTLFRLIPLFDLLRWILQLSTTFILIDLLKRTDGSEGDYIVFTSWRTLCCLSCLFQQAQKEKEKGWKRDAMNALVFWNTEENNDSAWIVVFLWRWLMVVMLEKPVVLSEAVVPTDVGSRKVDLL